MLDGMFGSAGQRALEGRLAALITGRTVLSQDIANIDTPGYRGADAPSFAAGMQAALTAQLGGTPPSQTGAGSGVVPLVAPAPVLAAGAATPGAATPTASTAAAGAAAGSAGVVTPDGNGMDFNALMVQLAKNDLDYQAVARQLQLTYQNLSTAIDSAAGGGG